jgi:hypothetical protein
MPTNAELCWLKKLLADAVQSKIINVCYFTYCCLLLVEGKQAATHFLKSPYNREVYLM